jgi:hypothetical protein
MAIQASGGRSRLAVQTGTRRTRLDVLVGTGIVMVVLLGLVALGQNHMGHTRTINYNLDAPRQAAPRAPAWMQQDSRD